MASDGPLTLIFIYFRLIMGLMICKECRKYEQHKDKCWFYWDEKRACSRFEDGMGERFKDLATDFDMMLHSLIEEHNKKR